MTGNSVKKGHREDTGELGIPGLEHYSLRDYKRLLARRKSMIIAIVFTVAIVASMIVYLLPNKYRASTIVMVDPSKVAGFLKSTTELSAAERLGLLQQQIMSDSKLSQVIEELNLYSEMRKKETPDVVLLQMRKDILVEPVVFSNRDLQAFKVSFTSGDANTAARVANRLASLFIEENLQSREQEVIGTAEFFGHELQKAKDDLAEKSGKLEELRTRYASALPEAQSIHLQALSALELEMRGEMDSVSRARQAKAYLQASLSDSPGVVDLDATANANGTQNLQQQIGELEGELDQLRSRYGPQFPDVLKKESEIAALKKQINVAAPVAVPGPVKQGNPVIQSQIAALDQEIQSHLQRENDLKSQIQYHEQKLEGAPAAAGQIAAATRDYDNAADNLKRLEDHKFAADVSSDVLTREKGERFVILQPAQPPSHPSEPNRVLIDLLALLAGIPMALFIVVGREMLDGTIKSGREINELLQAQVPVYGEVPWLETPAGRRRQRFRTLLAAGGNAVLALGYFAFLTLAVR